MEKLDYEWIERAEREYNNCLTGNLQKEKKAYLRGIEDYHNSISREMENLKERNEELESENNDLTSEIDDLKERVDELKEELNEYN